MYQSDINYIRSQEKSITNLELSFNQLNLKEF